MMYLLSTLIFLQTQPLEATIPSDKEIQALSPKTENSRSVMILDPKSRANDYLEAFNLLKAEKSTAKIVFHLVDGQKISNVIDMKMMPNNTIVVFRYNAPQGVTLRAVEIESIESINLQ